MKDICEQVMDLLKDKQEIVMATILNKSGSAPRDEGTKMLIKKDFSIMGTIGGGLLEAMAMKLSASVFNSREFVIEDFILSNKDAGAIGMACGGDVEVLLEYIDPFDKNMVKIYEKANELRKNGIDFVMITKISEKNGYISGRDKWICTETAFYGVEDNEIQRITKSIREDFNDIKIKLVHGKERYLIEPFYNFERVCIIGAGHVAQKIADLTKNLGFYTIVVDDREEFANTKRFQTAQEVRVIPSFDNLTNIIEINHNSYIVIVTRGHSYDKEVLAQMLKTDAKYIGMIGSHTKRDHTYHELLQEGFARKDIERVHCPIGIKIYAQTPEEIAISIVAELIKVRRLPTNEKK
ncbi:XdhC family aldehyde oxidoreductase maturation factor [Marinisporobacter balticus]|uniref:Xanthine dehydrogenase accessory factor n=1 Tax=Marinisporobacter balticus TaxID=2018667 RepID=A0A4R2KM76_9FIRM|nr:xanthine dehydrogenase accessory protein XdhC [Marinisporobacter balticus]TCO71826.1 xanthine dehydrogenase accessory factor [Marinisporobacter balticus]